MCAAKKAPTRSYTLRRRAEQQAETRRRIVEAAMALHGSLGPAFTTFSMVAERAGVQRHTLYAHFPDERSLLLACSAHHLAGDPPPDPRDWAEIADPCARLVAALGAIYAWYDRNEGLVGCVLRDAGHHAALREITEMRFGPRMAAWRASLAPLAEGADGAALLGLALSFQCWRLLAREGGRGSEGAARLMAAALRAASRAGTCGCGPAPASSPGPGPGGGSHGEGGGALP